MNNNALSVVHIHTHWEWKKEEMLNKETYGSLIQSAGERDHKKVKCCLWVEWMIIKNLESENTYREFFTAKIAFVTAWTPQRTIWNDDNGRKKKSM